MEVLETWAAILIADGREVTLGLSLLIRRALPLVAQLLALERGTSGVLAFFAYLVSSATFGLLTLLLIRHNLPQAGASTPVTAILKQARPYWVSSTSTQARELETALVGMGAGAAAAGFYSVAYRLTKPFALLGSAAAQVLLRQTIRNPHGTTVRRYLVFLGAVGVGAMFLGAALGKSFSNLALQLLGQQYNGATNAIHFAVIFAGPAMLSSAAGSVVQGLGRATTTGRVGLLSAILGSVATLTFATASGPTAAVIAVGAVYSCKFALLLLIAWRLSPSRS